MTQNFTLTVNGKTHTIDADPDMPLLYALRDDLGLNNPHFGCGLAQCGACTVHIDGQAIRSCVTPVSSVGDAKIVTLAGLGTPEKPHPLQTAYVEEQVPQCGYCINGWIMTAAAFLRDKKKPTDAEIKDALEGLKCRCGTHVSILKAVKRAADDDGLRESDHDKIRKDLVVLPPLGAAGRRRAGGLGRRAGRARDRAGRSSRRYAQGAKPPLTPDQLSSYIAVNADGTRRRLSSARWTWATACTSPSARSSPKSSTCRSRPSRSIMGDTATSVNQGGASGSTGIQLGGKQMRMAAAEARRVLVEMAAGKLGRAGRQAHRQRRRGQRRRRQGQDACPTRELIGGKYFNVQLDWNKQIRQRALCARQGAAEEAERPQDRRPADQARGRGAEGVRAGGLRHRHQSAGHGARPHDPPAGRRRGAGEGRRKLDQGHSRRQGGLGQGLPRRRRRQGMGRDPGGARSSRSNGRNVEPPFPDQAALYDHIRKAPVRKREVETSRTAMSTRRSRPPRKVIEAEYEWPFQSHASMGPACALVEIKDGKVTCWSGTQKSHFVQDGLAAHARRAGRQSARDLDDRARLLRPQRRRRLRHGLPRCWPRRSASRCGCNTCATRAPAGTRRARPRSTRRARRSTPQGNVIAYEFTSKGFSRVDVNTNGSKPFDTLAGQTLGVALKSGDGFGVPAESYAFDNKRLAWETIPPLLDRSSPLRTSHLRDPVGPQIHFASESFMDEVAAAVERRPDRVPPAAHQGPARHRRDQGGGGEGRLGHAALAAQGPDRQQGDRAAASPIRSATAPASR